MLLRSILKALFLGNLIWETASRLSCDCALAQFGKTVAEGANMLMSAPMFHFGVYVTQKDPIFFFLLRNAYKISVLIHAALLLLAVHTILPFNKGPTRLLRRLVAVLALLLSFRSDLSSGRILTLSEADLHRLIQMIVVVAGLHLSTFDMKMRRLMARRRQTQKILKEEARKQQKQAEEVRERAMQEAAQQRRRQEREERDRRHNEKFAATREEPEIKAKKKKRR